MSKFKKGGKKGVQAFNTASLPDIIFMLLFFFMVTTVMRENELLVQVSAPKADQVKKLENKALVSYIFVGRPQQSKVFGTLPRIQLNDAFAEPEKTPVGKMNFQRHPAIFRKQFLPAPTAFSGSLRSRLA